MFVGWKRESALNGVCLKNRLRMTATTKTSWSVFAHLYSRLCRTASQATWSPPQFFCKLLYSIVRAPNVRRTSLRRQNTDYVTFAAIANGSRCCFILNRKTNCAEQMDMQCGSTRLTKSVVSITQCYLWCWSYFSPCFLKQLALSRKLTPLDGGSHHQEWNSGGVSTSPVDVSRQDNGQSTL